MVRGTCMARGACMAKGVCVAGGTYMAGGHTWQGVGAFVAGGCAWQGDMHGRKDGHCNGWYASSWNAFLLCKIYCLWNGKRKLQILKLYGPNGYTNFIAQYWLSFYLWLSSAWKSTWETEFDCHGVILEIAKPGAFIVCKSWSWSQQCTHQKLANTKRSKFLMSCDTYDMFEFPDISEHLRLDVLGSVELQPMVLHVNLELPRLARPDLHQLADVHLK